MRSIGLEHRADTRIINVLKQPWRVFKRIFDSVGLAEDGRDGMLARTIPFSPFIVRLARRDLLDLGISFRVLLFGVFEHATEFFAAYLMAKIIPEVRFVKPERDELIIFRAIDVVTDGRIFAL
jgi:hypothetical protein